MVHYPATIVGLGEILWDTLPSTRTLGGAPANFAYMVNALGDHGVVASRVGWDSSGNEIIEQMQRCGLSTSYLQRDPTCDTGYSVVTLDAEGQASYHLAEPVAWDNLEWTESWQTLASKADAVCFGTLGQRCERSAETIEAFLEASGPKALRVFDANLRAPYIDLRSVLRSLRYADLLKVNEQEFRMLLRMLGYSEQRGEERLAATLLRDFDLRLVCITRGARGSLLISKSEMVDHPSVAVDVVDSIGTGDAFTACLVHHYIRGASLEHIGEIANRFAGWVATQAGATPRITPETLDMLLLPAQMCQ